MKAVMLAAQQVLLAPHATGPHAPVLVCGGFESMSNIPYYAPDLRKGAGFGHKRLVDGIIHDGLWDVYGDQHMGSCAEACAAQFGFSRQDQDIYALRSYDRALAAAAGAAAEAVAPVEVETRGTVSVMGADEEPAALQRDKVASLRPAFEPQGGTVTAANASSINDGGAAMVVMSLGRAREVGIEPMARIAGFADAEQAPVAFTTSPALAVPKALASAHMTLQDVHVHEINEAFAVVALANMALLDIDPDDVNVLGGAVALGHPIGMSGCRILGTALRALTVRGESVAVASICNGGGGASAMVLERLK